MLLHKLVGEESRVFFCRYCGYLHESRENLWFRQDSRNHVTLYCSFCNHKLSGSDFFAKAAGYTRNISERKLLFSLLPERNMLHESMLTIWKGIIVDALALGLIEIKETPLIHWKEIIGAAPDKEISGFRQKVGEGLAGKAIQYRTPLRIFNLMLAPQESQQQYSFMKACGLVSAMAIPLVYKENIIGCILAGNKRPTKFSNAKLKHFEELAYLA